jgi:hypothetical protein
MKSNFSLRISGRSIWLFSLATSEGRFFYRTRFMADRREFQDERACPFELRFAVNIEARTRISQKGSGWHGTIRTFSLIGCPHDPDLDRRTTAQFADDIAPIYFSPVPKKQKSTRPRDGRWDFGISIGHRKSCRKQNLFSYIRERSNLSSDRWNVRR